MDVKLIVKGGTAAIIESKKSKEKLETYEIIHTNYYTLSIKSLY